VWRTVSVTALRSQTDSNFNLHQSVNDKRRGGVKLGFKRGGKDSFDKRSQNPIFFKIKWIFSIKALIKERIINYIINS